jgi:SAM-dependent methyltransferase
MSTAALPSQFTYSGSELDSLAEAVNYYTFIQQQFARHLGERVVEVGAGIGTFAEYLLRGTTTKQLTLIEPAENNLPHLRHRFATDSRVTTMGGYLESHAASLRADSIVAVNVLEHVQDDVAFLRAARQVLAPSGRLLLYVPAMPIIFGTLDRAFDHYRRYTKQLLNAGGVQLVPRRDDPAEAHDRATRRTALRPVRRALGFLARQAHRAPLRPEPDRGCGAQCLA